MVSTKAADVRVGGFDGYHPKIGKHLLQIYCRNFPLPFPMGCRENCTEEAQIYGANQ